MAKPRCANCGAELIMMATREGLRLGICSNLKVSWTRSVMGTLRVGHIYCRGKIEGLQASFDKLTCDTGITLEKLRKVTHQTIPDADLLENANLAIMLGLPKKQLLELFEAAYRLALGVGIKPTRGIEALCKGVGRRSRLILDNIGITFKPTDAYDWYKTENELKTLTTAQKTHAWQKYALKLIKEHAKRLEK